MVEHRRQLRRRRVRQHSVIPDDVRRRQLAVAESMVSAWVTANAGAGKTYVLVQRVINLLLDGVAPEKILCITFTKAGAANMAKRVFETLAKWTTLDDTGLDKAILDLSGNKPDAMKRAAARRLFARALETPGGLKVQTIHAFCTQLLHQFPFEANVAARFEVLDEAERNEMLERLTLQVLLEGAEKADSDLGRALSVAMMAAADVTFRDVVREAIGKHDAIATWVTDKGGLPAALAGLSKSLGVAPSDDVAKVDAEFFSASLIPSAQWPAFAEGLAQGSKTDNDRARGFKDIQTQTGAERLETYLDIFCTKERSARKTIATKSIKDQALVDRLIDEQDRICKLLGRRRAVICRDRSAALLTVAYDVLKRYRDEKERRGLLDYDDLIDRTGELLTSVDARWVHFKLDLGIDHLLVDEAQDTSKKQWDIIVALTDEFAAGAGARDVIRTIFVVGDEKQSIYSFQNAAPREFADRRLYFMQRFEKAGLKFIPMKFEHSFRSGDSVLGAVDTVFKDIFRSVTSDEGGFPPHIALPDVPAGLVEIWEPEQPDERPAMQGWDAPFDTVSETSPRVKLARRIASAVQRLIARNEAKPGDILILVRSRGELFEAIIRALKNAEIAVAGADRLVLTEHIAVMDLMVLADALLLPQDDLALATVLRSPLFGFSDQDLYDVAYNRSPLSLREALAQRPGETFAAAAARLEELARAARRETPFTFYANILGAGGGRRQIWSRLGPEANDALDEFLNLALDYERRETPSLQGFVAWLRDAQTEIKRDMEIARDEVRVMTVHGAKGLEAPVVILADTTSRPTGPKPPRLLTIDGAMIWPESKTEDVPAVADARTSADRETENEYRRLLYVAMTRAEDRLIICGADGKTKRPDGCWYGLVCEPLGASLVEEDDNGEKVFRYRKAQAGKPQAAAQSAGEVSQKPIDELPAWLHQPAPAQAPLAIPLAPSSAFDDDIERFAPNAGSAADREKALDKGRIVHRLMQSLPDIPAEHRQGAAARHLKHAAAKFNDAEQAAIVQQVLAILSDPDFAELFAPRSRAEVPIIGKIPNNDGPPFYVSGQIDRVAVTANEVLIADYKTDRVPPRTLDEVKPYVAQLALYRAVLARIYPHKTVRAALLFTEGPQLMEIPAAAMDTALAEILTKDRHAPVKVP
jgi:ATP-dependent helicase/nuclease subunit A